MARDDRHVKIIPQRFSSFRSFLMYQGPKTSMPVYMKGGAGVSRSSERFAIFWTWGDPRNLRQVTHF